jgi:hypothetical protein
VSGPATRCARVRERAALAPDGELSELERRLLDAHLAHCEPCRLFARRVAAVAAELRAAAAARPAARAAPSRGRALGPRLRTAALAAVAATALGVGVRAPVPERPAPPTAVDATAEMHVLRELRREALVASASAAEERPTRFGVLPA